MIEISVTEPFHSSEGWNGMYKIIKLVAQKMGYSYPSRYGSAVEAGIPPLHFAILFPEIAINDPDTVMCLEHRELWRLFNKLPSLALSRYGDLIRDDEVFPLAEKVARDASSYGSWHAIPLDRLNDLEVQKLLSFKENKGCLTYFSVRLSTEKIFNLIYEVEDNVWCIYDWYTELFEIIRERGDQLVELVEERCPEVWHKWCQKERQEEEERRQKEEQDEGYEG